MDCAADRDSKGASQRSLNITLSSKPIRDKALPIHERCFVYANYFYVTFELVGSFSRESFEGSPEAGSEDRA